MMGLLDTIAPTPRNRFLGLLADAAQGVSDFAARPFGYDNPPGAIVASLLGVPDIAKTLDRLSYGEPLTTGTGMTLRPREEAVNAAMAALPLGATLGKGAIDAGVYAAQKAAPAIERVVPRIMKRGGLPAEILRGMSQQTVSPLTVWHGSPHKFDKFDASKIGTGEGAQAYGHGLYLAESPDVARGYKNALSPGAGIGDDDTIVRALKMHGGDPIAAAKDLEQRAQYANIPGGKEKLLSLSEKLKAGYDPSGSLYKVDLPDEHIAKMLDWDKPLRLQSQELQALARQHGITDPNGEVGGVLGKGLYESIGDGKASAQTAEKLKAIGVPGIRYLDGGSRGTGAGTSNFVVFPGNEEILKILERNGQPVGLLGN